MDRLPTKSVFNDINIHLDILKHLSMMSRFGGMGAMMQGMAGGYGSGAGYGGGYPVHGASAPSVPPSSTGSNSQDPRSNRSPEGGASGDRYSSTRA